MFEEDWSKRVQFKRTMNFANVLLTIVDGNEVKIPATVTLFADQFLKIQIPMNLE